MTILLCDLRWLRSKRAHDFSSFTRGTTEIMDECKDGMNLTNFFIITIPLIVRSRSKKINFNYMFQRQIGFMLNSESYFYYGTSALCEYIKCHRGHYMELENIGLRLSRAVCGLLVAVDSLFFSPFVSTSWHSMTCVNAGLFNFFTFHSLKICNHCRCDCDPNAWTNVKYFSPFVAGTTTLLSRSARLHDCCAILILIDAI